jgi:hypothetical protein
MALRRFLVALFSFAALPAAAEPSASASEAEEAPAPPPGAASYFALEANLRGASDLGPLFLPGLELGVAYTRRLNPVIELEGGVEASLFSMQGRALYLATARGGVRLSPLSPGSYLPFMRFGVGAHAALSDGAPAIGAAALGSAGVELPVGDRAVLSAEGRLNIGGLVSFRDGSRGPLLLPELLFGGRVRF